MRECLEVVEELGQTVDSLRLIGGGAKSALWARILCDVLGKPLLKPEVEDAAFGAALLAGVAVGVFDDWQSAARVCRIERVLEPDARLHSLYNSYFDVYREVTKGLTHSYHRLAAISVQSTKEDVDENHQTEAL